MIIIKNAVKQRRKTGLAPVNHIFIFLALLLPVWVSLPSGTRKDKENITILVNKVEGKFLENDS